jgi:hypothetical protein
MFSGDDDVVGLKKLVVGTVCAVGDELDVCGDVEVDDEDEAFDCHVASVLNEAGGVILDIAVGTKPESPGGVNRTEFGITVLALIGGVLRLAR